MGGTYASHIRDEGNGIDAALDEAFRIGREAKIPVEIWHLKAAGKSNWGRMPEIVARIDAARRAGVDVAADTYAYTAGFNSFSAIIPPWAHDGGDKKLIERLKDPAMRARIRKEMETPSGDWNNEWQQVTGPESFIVGAVQNPKLLPLQGKTHRRDRADLAQGPHRYGLRPADSRTTLSPRWRCSSCPSPTWCWRCSSRGSRSATIRKAPRPAASSARNIRTRARTAPSRTFCAKYVREEKKLTLEDAIRKFTALPAQRMRFADRGVLKAGMWADVVVFDPDTIHDLATFDAPNQLSEGMRFVLVNGVPVIDEGKMTNALPGKVLDRR